MKIEFEKNITVMKTLSYILVASSKIYSDHANSIGINIPTKALLIFTLFPVIYIFIYPLFKILKRKVKEHEDYFTYLNDLTIFNFIMLGVFMTILIFLEFWHSLGILMPIIYINIAVLLASSLIVFLSLGVSLVYVSVGKKI